MRSGRCELSVSRQEDCCLGIATNGVLLVCFESIDFSLSLRKSGVDQSLQVTSDLRPPKFKVAVKHHESWAVMFAGHESLRGM